MTIRADQPGSQPLEIPEAVPNPAAVPHEQPAPQEPAPKEPVKVPEKAPAGVRPRRLTAPISLRAAAA